MTAKLAQGKADDEQGVTTMNRTQNLAPTEEIDVFCKATDDLRTALSTFRDDLRTQRLNNSPEIADLLGEAVQRLDDARKCLQRVKPEIV